MDMNPQHEMEDLKRRLERAWSGKREAFERAEDAEALLKLAYTEIDALRAEIATLKEAAR